MLAMDRPWIEAGLKYAKISKSDLPCLLVQRVARIRAKNTLNQKFLKCIIGSLGFTEYVLSIQTGTAVPHISTNQIKQFQFLCPPIEEQKAIANILSTLDDKIELNRRMNETLEAIARALFKAWFVDFEPVRANMENRPSESASPEIAKLFPSEFENGIPKGWTNGTVGDLATISKRTISPNKFQNEDFNHFSIPAFDERHRPKLEEGSLIQSNKFLIEKDSVLVSKLNPRIFRVWTVYAPKENRCIASTEFIIYQPQHKDYWSFLNSLMRSDEIISKFQQQVTGTSSSHQRVRPESTLSLDITIPSEETAKVFNKIMSAVYLQIEELIEQSQNLSQIRDSLLPRLIAGKIRVSELDGCYNAASRGVLEECK